MELKRSVYTIGYSPYKDADEMIQRIMLYGITCLIDVRSKPYSSYHTEFNKEFLSNKLRLKGILYRNYAREFGAMQTEKQYLTKDGYVDYDLFSRSEIFLSGVNKLIAGIDLGYQFVLMCAEKDPIDCHRGIMIGKTLKELGFEVKHILYPDQVETQEEMEIRAIGNQISFFDSDNVIEKFYQTQAKKIAFRAE